MYFLASPIKTSILIFSSSYLEVLAIEFIISFIESNSFGNGKLSSDFTRLPSSSGE